MDVESATRHSYDCAAVSPTTCNDSDVLERQSHGNEQHSTENSRNERLSSIGDNDQIKGREFDVGEDFALEARRRRRRKKHKRRKHKGAEDKMVPKKDSWTEGAGDVERNNLYPDTICGTDDDSTFPEASLEALKEFLESRVYCFDNASASPNVKCSSNVAQRNICKQSTDGARGLIGFQDGRHVLEVSFDEKPMGSHCSVGFVTEDVHLKMAGYGHLLGESSGGWCWDIPSRTLWHAGKVTGRFPEQEEGDDSPSLSHTFHLIIDRGRGTMSIDLGQGEVTIFSDLPDPSVVLYPAVSMVYGLSRVTFKVLESWLFLKYRGLTDNEKNNNDIVRSNNIDIRDTVSDVEAQQGNKHDSIGETQDLILEDIIDDGKNKLSDNDDHNDDRDVDAEHGDRRSSTSDKELLC